MSGPGDGLGGRDFADADLTDADLRNADLSETDLSGASLVDADLRGADLSNTDLTEASLVDADLRGADLTDAILDGADLADASLGGTGWDGDWTDGVEDGSLSSMVASVVTGATLVVAFSLLALGVSQFWVVFIVGFAGVLPVATTLASRYDRRTAETDDDNADAADADEQGDALDALRERYASGEIDEAEFERRVERLLETESVADAEHAYGDSDRDGARSTSDDRNVDDADRELERN